MEHVVFYPGPDAAPAFRRFSSLDDAVRFVEHLRNSEGVAEVSVHTLTPVPVAFRAYYKVEVPADEAVPPSVPEQSAPVDAFAVPVEPYAEPVEADPVAAEPVMADAVAEPDVAANGKRSLGFFAH